jgi:signal transduction histidine kinase
MFSNLIVNAVEASPRAASLTIRVREEGEEVAVRIHNYGVVPDDVRDRFFERYATSGKKRGTGLGTYSARLIARTHGGDISFTSTEQEGTWVEVRLPVGAQRYSDTMEASVS